MYRSESTISKSQVLVYGALLYCMSLTSIFTGISFMLGYECDYTITYKADSHQIHKHHSDHTFNAVITSLIVGIVIAAVSCVPVLFVSSHGMNEFSLSGFKRYSRNHTRSLAISASMCVILSIITGIAIGTEI